MKKNHILKTLMMVTVAALVLCGCASEPTSADVPETGTSVENPTDTPIETPSGDNVGDNVTTDAGTTPGEGTGDVPETVKSCEEIYEEIADDVTLQSPMIVPEDFVANYGVDFSGIDDYIFVMSELSTSVETIAIFKSGDAASRENVTAALETFADGKRAEMENYLPEQFDIVDRSSIKTSGDYVYLVISENAEAIEEIIAACLP